jgi:hypothetical protein
MLFPQTMSPLSDTASIDELSKEAVLPVYNLPSLEADPSLTVRPGSMQQTSSLTDRSLQATPSTSMTQKASAPAGAHPDPVVQGLRDLAEALKLVS